MQNQIYFFIDEESGEPFFVETYNLRAATMTACKNFKEPVYQGKVSEEEADALGYDTY